MAKDFTLKKYKITRAFGSYKAGQIVAFHAMDAALFKDKIKLFEEPKKDVKISTK